MQVNRISNTNHTNGSNNNTIGNNNMNTIQNNKSPPMIIKKSDSIIFAENELQYLQTCTSVRKDTNGRIIPMNSSI